MTFHIIIITELWVISAPEFNFLDISNSGIGIYGIVFHGIEMRYRDRVLLRLSTITKIVVCNLLWSMEDYRPYNFA